MGRKIFVSYKYGDMEVEDLDLYEDNFWGSKSKIQTKARHYVDELTKILDDADHIFKGEDDGQSLADFEDEYIASTLRDKIYDSSTTVVLVSKGMKNIFENEVDQWMPWEISYSLREPTRDGRTSKSNAIIMVVLPDILGLYDYYITNDTVCNCRSLDTSFLFNILKANMFNKKNPTTSRCSNGSILYHGDSCYIQSVKWSDFIEDYDKYINKAVLIRDNIADYNITKKLY